MRSAQKLLALALIGILALAPSLTSASPASAHTNSSCTFDIPKPTFDKKSRTAGFKVTVRCSGLSIYGNRQAVVDLREKDGLTSQYITHRAKNTAKKGTYTISASGIRCNYDKIGNEELYINVRIETKLAGQSYWSKHKNYRGAVLSASCK